MEHLVRLGVVDVVKTPPRIVLELVSYGMYRLRAQESRLEERDSRDAPRDEALRFQYIKPLQTRVLSCKLSIGVGTH